MSILWSCLAASNGDGHLSQISDTTLVLIGHMLSDGLLELSGAVKFNCQLRKYGTTGSEYILTVERDTTALLTRRSIGGQKLFREYVFCYILSCLLYYLRSEVHHFLRVWTPADHHHQTTS